MKEEFKPFKRHDSVSLGMIKVVQALTAVVYTESKVNRDALEKQLRSNLEETKHGEVDVNLNLYRAPIEAALNVIAQIKASETQR
ncbi:hypothetical protein JFT59_26450 [Pseudomonas sp. MF6784]|jgi:hypothetical protein|uniref:hypothetical protein n=1 Tax=Pseudomonas sp. MF6784 TaxID=2797535 RepID=UPI0018E852D6|nr:hypothetical protein [Pseudomonas sp. MF6784]MBJ2254738.1 hypothetical protein [Pseudomonas sp. MF6784]